MGRTVANDERVPLYNAHEWIFNARDAWTLGLDDLKLVARMLYGLFAVRIPYRAYSEYAIRNTQAYSQYPQYAIRNTQKGLLQCREGRVQT